MPVNKAFGILPGPQARAFCGWGEGPDVGINIYKDGKVSGAVDLTPAMARGLANQLILAAHAAEHEQSIRRLHRSREEGWSCIVS